MQTQSSFLHFAHWRSVFRLHSQYFLDKRVFYQDNFHEDQKGQKLLKKKSFLWNYLGLSFVIKSFGKDGPFYDPFKPSFPCPNKITIPLSSDANLGKLGPILGKLY